MSEQNLRVMTFNLLTSTKKRRSHPWRLRKINIAKIFNSLKPDVVGTQEANFHQLHELAALLPDYHFIGEGNLGREKAASESNWYCATFYRKDRIRLVATPSGGDTLWLSPTPEVPASQFHLGTRPRVVTWNTFELIDEEIPFIFGTTHLEAVNPFHRKKSARLMREYVSRKVAEMGKDIPIFLTGDFNAVSDSPEICAMGQDLDELEPLFDAWAEHRGANSLDGATFRGLGMRDKMGHKILGPRRIDYVFYRPRLQVHSVDRIDFKGMDHREQALPSDHYPVLVDFGLAI